MSTRIGSTDETTRWGAHTAFVHLRKDWQQLTADKIGGADKHVIAADKAALVESRVQIAQTFGIHRVDITV